MQEDPEQKLISCTLADQPHTLVTRQKEPCAMLLGFMTTIKAIWPFLHSTWRKSSLALLEKILFLSADFIQVKKMDLIVVALSLKQEIEETILICLVESLSMVSLSRAADISQPLVCQFGGRPPSHACCPGNTVLNQKVSE